MKFCPVCQTRFDEEILRFCTKDGTLLVEENPNFTALPSDDDAAAAAADDIDEQTLIRRHPPRDAVPPPPTQYVIEQPQDTGERLIIPTTDDDEWEPEPAPVRAKAQPEYIIERKPNTALVVLVTIFGTLFVLGSLGGIWYMLNNRSDNGSNRNVNVNTNPVTINTNLNTNANVSNSLANFNFSTSPDENVNANANANVKTPTPTPTRSPTPTPTLTPQNSNVNSNGNLNLGNTNVMSTPTPAPTPSQTPRPSPSQTPPPQNVNVGVMNSRAVSLTKPAYPQSAKQVNATGQVTVQISVDEEGNVTAARAVSGHPLLRSPAENAARQSRFNPVKIADRAVRANGLVVYNFINQ